MTTPKQSTTPSTSQGHGETAGECEDADGLKADTRETDPPLKDLGNADEASIVTTLWMRCPTMWPQDGNETSCT